MAFAERENISYSVLAPPTTHFSNKTEKDVKTGLKLRTSWNTFVHYHNPSTQIFKSMDYDITERDIQRGPCRPKIIR